MPSIRIPVSVGGSVEVGAVAEDKAWLVAAALLVIAVTEASLDAVASPAALDAMRLLAPSDGMVIAGFVALSVGVAIDAVCVAFGGVLAVTLP